MKFQHGIMPEAPKCTVHEDSTLLQGERILTLQERCKQNIRDNPEVKKYLESLRRCCLQSAAEGRSVLDLPIDKTSADAYKSAVELLKEEVRTYEQHHGHVKIHLL
jgi:hypothetical protein